MAIASTTVWELRTTGTASNVNGGGFNPSNATPGTDYSQQDTAQYTFTDLASTSASSWLVVTSASHNFVAADCGNLIHINSTGTGAHFTVGWYEIVSCSGNAATLDRACGSTADASGGTYHVGGALGDGSIAPLGGAGAVGGNTVYVKSGTYTVSGATNWNWAGQLIGTSSLQCFVIGYNSVRGDNPTGSNRPQINFATGVFLTGSFVTWMNLSFNSAHANASEGTVFWSGGTGVAYNCKFINTSTTANIPCLGNSTNIQCFGCEFSSYSGRCIQYTSYCAFMDCWFHDSPFGIHNNGVTLATLTVIGCIFSNITTAAIHSVSGSTWNVGVVMNCTFFGGVGTKNGIGINLLGSTDQHFSVYNSIFYGLTTGYLSAQLTGANYGNYNNYFNNTTDVSGLTKGPNSIALDPAFTSVGQYTGTTATSSGTTLTDSGAAFTNVVAGRDFLYVSASTGGNTGIFGITSKTATTIVTDNSLGSGSAITYSIIYGQNFAVGTSMKAVGSGSTGNPNSTTYVDIGAVQRQEGNGGYPRGRIVNA